MLDSVLAPLISQENRLQVAALQSQYWFFQLPNPILKLCGRGRGVLNQEALQQNAEMLKGDYCELWPTFIWRLPPQVMPTPGFLHGFRIGQVIKLTWVVNTLFYPWISCCFSEPSFSTVHSWWAQFPLGTSGKSARYGLWKYLCCISPGRSDDISLPVQGRLSPLP